MARALTLATMEALLRKEVQFSPSTAQAARDFRADINAVQVEFLTAAEPWPFMVRRAPLLALPDLDLTDVALSWVHAREFKFNNTPGAGVFAGLLPDEGGSGQMSKAILAAMLGGEVHTQATLSDLGEDWAQAPFVIENARSVTLLWTWHLTMDPRMNTTSLEGTERLKLRFPRLKLPADVGEVLAVYDDQGAPLAQVSSAEARDSGLWARDPGTGRPRWALADAGHESRVPAHVTPNDFVPGAFPWEHQSNDLMQLGNTPTNKVITVGVNPGGTLPLGSYMVSICWWYAGRFGPLSEAIQASVVSLGVQTLVVLGLPELASSNYGRKVAVFVASIGANGAVGAPYLQAFVTDPTDTSVSIATFQDQYSPWRRARYDALSGSPDRYLRLWPRPATYTPLLVEYRANPHELLDPDDQPEFDPQYHEILVWLAASRIAGRNNDDGLRVRADSRAARIFGQMRAHYFGAQGPHQKGMMGGGGRRSLRSRFNVPTDYRGPG